MKTPISAANAATSPFHEGEQIIQSQLGVRDKMEQFGQKVIRDHMPEQHRQFYQQLPFMFAGFIDDNGAPWASILHGESGFITSTNNRSLHISAQILPGDPIQAALTKERFLGLLGIELPSRRRNRLSTKVSEVDSNGFELDVIQSFGNCPQYIQARHLIPLVHDNVAENHQSERLNDETRQLIESSDTFFVASHYNDKKDTLSNGADISHRGGKPGFVRVEHNKTLTIPDYLGNFHFNTLGNFIKNPKAGLLFIDFKQGHVLSLTGSVDILWESDELQYFAGAERLWQFHIEKVVYLKYVLPFSFELEDYSPTTLITGTWQQSEQAKQDTWQTATIDKIVKESKYVSSFYLAPDTGHISKFLAGQYLTVNAKINNKQQTRTYTLSSAPNDNFYRISVKQEPLGAFSNYLHKDIQVGDTLDFKAAAGHFHFDPNDKRPAVLIAAGIGITPMLSMARHLLQDAVRTRSMRRTYMFCAVRNISERSFFTELNDLAKQSNSHLQVIWLMSSPEEHAQQSVDYHFSGHISQQVLQSVLPIDNYQFYLCGPSGFTQNIYDIAIKLGISNEDIFTEAFGPSSLKKVATIASTTSTAVALAPMADSAIVEFTESQFEQAWSTKDGNLLSFAEAHGLSPEYGCRSGKCGACKVKLISGKVSYQQEPECTHSADEIVLCCASPAKDPQHSVAKLRILL